VINYNEIVADETNIYSVQKDGKSVDTDQKEIEKMLGMYLLMGIVCLAFDTIGRMKRDIHQ
jgi:hypothetical protein